MKTVVAFNYEDTNHRLVVDDETRQMGYESEAPDLLGVLGWQSRDLSTSTTLTFALVLRMAALAASAGEDTRTAAVAEKIPLVDGHRYIDIGKI